MNTTNEWVEKIGQSITLKATIIGFMTLVMLIPGFMIRDLISERKARSEETIGVINEKWSKSQTVNGPVLVVPFIIEQKDENSKLVSEKHWMYIAPEVLNIKAKLFPEVRHYGIYKTILYKSELQVSGSFGKLDTQKFGKAVIHWDEAYFSIGVSDLRGITNNIEFGLDGTKYRAEAAGKSEIDSSAKGLNIFPQNAALFLSGKPLAFNFSLNLKGSSDLNFIPLGKNTKVQLSGAWKSPGFIGNFSPEYKLADNKFTAVWSVLPFNRNIPEMWIDREVIPFKDSSFGVNLVDTVDHYQQNMRSAKYALMFIGLTFVVFFFVEILTRKRIHPIQYFLVGIALILFYTLLLSLSEQIGFGGAYLIASVAIIGLITAYAQSIFKNLLQTGMLATMLGMLYVFLYVILQLEDIALLIGSVGLFIILGVIMYFSKKIVWYKPRIEVSDDVK